MAALEQVERAGRTARRTAAASGTRGATPGAVRGEQRTRRQRKPSWFAAKLTSLRTALTAWLSRPLASFHLVLALCGMLAVIGTVMVLSASSVESTYLTEGATAYSLFKKHVVFLLVGMVVFWIALRLPLRVIRGASSTLLFVSLALLVTVLSPLGAVVNGSQGWIVVGGFSLQPVEVAKVALALWGAHILVLKARLAHLWRHVLVPLVPVALVMFALLMAQPDLGGTVSLGVVLVALLWFGGAPRGLFAAVIAGGVAGVIGLALIADYRLARVLSFLSPDTDSADSGYQAQQAQYALADGGLLGRGLGQGGSKWHYLPNVHHDFIFALIGEELGFLGCAVVIGLFAGVAIVGLRIATRNIDPWIRVVAGTLTVWLVSQAAINIGYVAGLLPVTGVTLPLISYGGTSLVVTLGQFGILANCARHEPEAVAALRTQGPGKFGTILRLRPPEPYRPRSKPAGGGRQPRRGRPPARNAAAARSRTQARQGRAVGRTQPRRGGRR
ncbi:putative lipid II flippase FtsW [Haloechinothrix halophila]|uniref:putative lipid II flippase FtsW n=1 Tax=Haloechinothrix halophila TaxID=1069073 RepID=UPI0004161981|nr:putative lipid II flippase FtsW [Haloechinothrix halophila]